MSYSNSNNRDIGLPKIMLQYITKYFYLFTQKKLANRQSVDLVYGVHYLQELLIFFCLCLCRFCLIAMSLTSHITA